MELRWNPPSLPSLQSKHVPHCQALVPKEALPRKCFNPHKSSGRWIRVPCPTPNILEANLRISKGALGTRFTNAPPRFFSKDCFVLSHFLLLKEHLVYLGTAGLPLLASQTSSLRHLGPSPRRCWCSRVLQKEKIRGQEFGSEVIG